PRAQRVAEQLAAAFAAKDHDSLACDRLHLGQRKQGFTVETRFRDDYRCCTETLQRARSARAHRRELQMHRELPPGRNDLHRPFRGDGAYENRKIESVEPVDESAEPQRVARLDDL